MASSPPIVEASLNAAVLCSKLSTALPGKVFLPGSLEYNSSVDSYFFRTAKQTPACILKPQSADEVEAIVKILAANPGVKFAIRSGGHTPNPCQSNVDNGVTIDLRGLKRIDKKEGQDGVLSVGTGAEWGDVYDYLENTGRGAVGSRESSVGVGGFITGGGLSFFAPELGFACDNVVNMEIVTSKGIVNANAHENTDLFRAIRGGQGNFGIVTRFDIKTHERNTYWGGGILYPDTTEDAQFQAWSDLKNGKYDPYAAVIQSYLYFGAQKAFMVSNNMVYLKHIERPTGLAGFENIQPQVPGTNTMRLDTTKNFALELQAWQPLDQYAVYVTTTIKLSPSVGKKINSIWREATNLISDSPNITSVLTYQQFPPQDKDNPNGMGLNASDELHKDHFIIIISIYWHEIKDSERIANTTKDAVNKMEAAAAEENALHPFKYINYAAFWQQPPSSYGQGAKDAAEEVSAKYDPYLLFRKQAVGFKYS
ncbi:FAD-binding domain-containing protein [Periconia macrospinosa]|uniref:FAD-binding domain-containing protein n=1 Tax=Periconia macrospinosa TaxID=97972 RepID=A0A2V1D8C1_9PLEO|nr:FAD-binding domain-containing protein [Periconia macrospinosa]